MVERILVAEDSPSIRKQLKAALREYDTRFASSGKSALDAVSDSLPDLILTDIRLPEMTGFELLGRLRADPATQDIPVILIAASEAAEESIDQLADHIVRPQDFRNLKLRIRALQLEHQLRRVFRDVCRPALARAAVFPTQDLTEPEARELSAGGFPVDAPVNMKPIADRASEYAHLTASGLSTAQAAALLRVNQSRIRQRLSSRPPTLYGIRRDSEWVLPAFQFHGRKLVPNIEKVIAKLDLELDLIAVYRWFTRPNPDLMQENQAISPLDWLRQGLSWTPVASLAENL